MPLPLLSPCALGVKGLPALSDDMFVCLSPLSQQVIYFFHCVQRVLLEPKSCTCGLRTLIHRHETVYRLGRGLSKNVDRHRPVCLPALSCHINPVVVMDMSDYDNLTQSSIFDSMFYIMLIYSPILVTCGVA